MTALPMPVVRRTLLPLALLVLGACGDTISNARPGTEPPAEQGPPGITPQMVVVSESADVATVELRLRRVGVTQPIASVQGVLTYDDRALDLAGAETGAGVTGAWNEVRPGVIRFSGVALGGLGDAAVVRLRFSAAAAVRAEQFSVTLEEVIAAEGFENLTTRAAAPGQPDLAREVAP